MKALCYRLADRVRRFLTGPLMDDQRMPRTDAGTQRLLQLHYAQQLRDGHPLPPAWETGLKVYSQTDEDGILLFLFALIGPGRRRAVEICAGDGIECNAANLVLNHGWQALLVDGDEGRIRRGERFYAKHPATYVSPPTFAREWVTRDNINELLAIHDLTGEIDLLSVDVDGVDYWLWKAVDVNPRVVVIEFQTLLGPKRCCTVPYADDFRADAYPMTEYLPNFAGASLAAMVKLGREKGYRLVACNRQGFNAFFLRNDLCPELPEMPVAQAFIHPWARWSIEVRGPTVASLPWEEV